MHILAAATCIIYTFRNETDTELDNTYNDVMEFTKLIGVHSVSPVQS